MRPDRPAIPPRPEPRDVVRRVIAVTATQWWPQVVAPVPARFIHVPQPLRASDWAFAL